MNEYNYMMIALLLFSAALMLLWLWDRLRKRQDRIKRRQREDQWDRKIKEKRAVLGVKRSILKQQDWDEPSDDG